MAEANPSAFVFDKKFVAMGAVLVLLALIEYNGFFSGYPPSSEQHSTSVGIGLLGLSIVFARRDRKIDAQETVRTMMIGLALFAMGYGWATMR